MDFLHQAYHREVEECAFDAYDSEMKIQFEDFCKWFFNTFYQRFHHRCVSDVYESLTLKKLSWSWGGTIREISACCTASLFCPLFPSYG